MISTLLAAAASAALAAAPTQAPDQGEQQLLEQQLLEQIHRCAVEQPMPDYCEALLDRLIDGEQL